MKGIIPLLVLLVAAGGCVTKVESPQTSRPVQQPPQPEVKRQTVTDRRVVIDPALEHSIRLVGVHTSSAGSFLKVQLDVQNLTGSIQSFNYQIEWFDQYQAPLPMADSAVLSWMLLGHETSFLANTAPTPAARDFRVTFIAAGK